MAIVIDALAWISARQGHHTRAATVFGIAAAIWQEVGASPKLAVSFAAHHDHHVAMTRDALGDDRYEAAFHRGRHYPVQRAIDFVLEAAPAARATSHSPGPAPLTKREWQIAGLVGRGLSNKDIAARLVIAPRTAEKHVDNILTKLAFTSRTQIASWYTEQQHKAT
jgi:non-specific serine/threonine protein kinase